MLKRKMKKFLLNWKSKDNRYPLIIRGSRQIGKTYSISYFGKSNYKYFININFVNNPEYSYVKYGIKLGEKNIGFNGKFYTFPYFLTFLLKRFINDIR